MNNAVGVHLYDEDGCGGPDFNTCANLPDRHRDGNLSDCVQIPREVYEHWQAASAAWFSVQDEIRDLIEARWRRP